MEDVIDIFKQAVSLFSYFKGFQIVIPFLAAISAAWWLQRKFKQQVALLTGELRAVAKTFDSSVKKTVAQVGADFEAAAGVVDRKREQLNRTMLDHENQAVSVATKDEDSAGSDQDEEAIRWAEMQAVWRDVKDWIDERLGEAINSESKGRANRLAGIRKTDYDDVILELFKYGWISDKGTDAGLELSGIYKQHRNRRMPVTKDALRTYHRVFKIWLAN